MTRSRHITRAEPDRQSRLRDLAERRRIVRQERRQSRPTDPAILAYREAKAKRGRA